MEFIDRRIHAFTCPIIVELGKNTVKSASGFFFDLSEENDPKKAGWVAIKSHWLVTNRHVLSPEYVSQWKKVTLKIRVFPKGALPHWHDLEILPEELVVSARFPNSPDIDVAVVDVSAQLINVIKLYSEHTGFSSVMNLDIAGEGGLVYGIGDDVLVVGYPKGYYDSFNLFPVIKSGVICSGFDLFHEGKPCFIVDTMLFPGSSGSAVISKPSIYGYFGDGKVMKRDKGKHFQILGIYSGDLTFGNASGKSAPHSYGLGVVWYARLIPYIINNGIDAIEYRKRFPPEKSNIYFDYVI